jgi:hypothetical protein
LLSFHKSIVNPADILPVKGIPTLVIANEANEEAVVTAWTSPLLILGICTIIEFERVVIVPSDTA